jgi:hypothetical protein
MHLLQEMRISSLMWIYLVQVCVVLACATLVSCNVEKGDCATNGAVCVNNGTCEDVGGNAGVRFYCNCTTALFGHSGVHCETLVDYSGMLEGGKEKYAYRYIYVPHSPLPPICVCANKQFPRKKRRAPIARRSFSPSPASMILLQTGVHSWMLCPRHSLIHQA